MSVQPVLVSFDDFMMLSKDSADLHAVKAIMSTEFPDDTCQILALKGVLGIEIPKEEEPEAPEEPGDEEPDPIIPPEGDENGEEPETP